MVLVCFGEVSCANTRTHMFFKTFSQDLLHSFPALKFYLVSSVFHISPLTEVFWPKLCKIHQVLPEHERCHGKTVRNKMLCLMDKLRNAINAFILRFIVHA